LTSLMMSKFVKRFKEKWKPKKLVRKRITKKLLSRKINSIRNFLTEKESSMRPFNRR
jgi:hypothetical protein